MRGPKPPVVKLVPRLPDLLEKISRRQTAAQHLVKRARIILNASQELNNTQIAKLLKIDLNTVRTWRGRWLAAEERLLNGVKAGMSDRELLALIARSDTELISISKGRETTFIYDDRFPDYLGRKIALMERYGRRKPHIDPDIIWRTARNP